MFVKFAENTIKVMSVPKYSKSTSSYQEINFGQ